MKKLVAMLLSCISLTMLLCFFSSCKSDRNTVRYCITELNLEDSLEAKKGTKYKVPVPDEMEYYTFLYYADEFGTPYTDEKGYSLKEFDRKDNPKLYATFKGDDILVRYDLDGGTSAMPEYSIVEYGKQLPELKNPTKEHAKFDGWYAENNEGGEFLVHDGIRFVNAKLTLNKNDFHIENAEITLRADYKTDTVDVTCVYYKNLEQYLKGEHEEKVVKIPYGSTYISPYMPTITNVYGETQAFVWSSTNEFGADEFSDAILEPITLYGIANETIYNGFYARQSFDKKDLMLDFRKTTKTNIDFVYTTASGTEEVIFAGNPSLTYTNFSIVISATTGDVSITLQDFNYVGRDDSPAFDAGKLSSECQLTIKSKGNSSIRGADGEKLANGTSYDRNSNEKHTQAANGERGKDGTEAQIAVIANNILFDIAKNGSLTLTGGEGGDGSDGGNGQGSRNDGIAQAGHGGDGGNGANGADALKVYSKLSSQGEGVLNVYGGKGGKGGNAGSGGNNLDKGLTDRADNGGNGGKGGRGGDGGAGISFVNSDSGNGSYLSLVLVKGGDGGKGGRGGDAGDGGKNELQSQGSAPGNAGDGGNGGNGGVCLKNCSFTVNKQLSSGGKGGTCGQYSNNPYAGGRGSNGDNGQSNL